LDSSAGDKIFRRAFFGPIGDPRKSALFFHFATVFGLSTN
jgi:hypothetical protein